MASRQDYFTLLSHGQQVDGTEKKVLLDTQSDSTHSNEIDFEVAIKQSPFMLFSTITL